MRDWSLQPVLMGKQTQLSFLNQPRAENPGTYFITKIILTTSNIQVEVCLRLIYTLTVAPFNSHKTCRILLLQASKAESYIYQEGGKQTKTSGRNKECARISTRSLKLNGLPNISLSTLVKI